MRLLKFFLAGAAVAVLAKSVSADQSGACTGIWAAGAKSPLVAANVPLQDIVAPDGKISIKAGDNGLSVIGRKSITHLDDVIGDPPVTEILWSPNSRNFVVNESDGGLVGTWTAYLYTLDLNDKPVPYHLEKLMRSVIARIPNCELEESANFGAITWLNDGKELLLVAEVPPHSSCKNMGDVVGFRVSLQSRKIVERLSESTLRKKWSGMLGCRFKSGGKWPALGMGKAQQGADTPSAEATESLKKFLRTLDNDRTARYLLALRDLNGDGTPEAIVHLIGSRCGSGGCSTFILTPNGSSWRIVTNISITRPPVYVLSDMSKDWHSIGVWVQGGGVQPGYEAELRFNGKTYPKNPSVSPARRLKGKPMGEVVIPSTQDAKLLYDDQTDKNEKGQGRV